MPLTSDAASNLHAAPDSGRQRILDVAARSFLERGYEATSLRHVADAAGMKAGSLYYHFDSKEDLLTEILRRGVDVMQAAFDDAARGAVLSPAQRVVAHVRAHLAALFENGPYTAAHITTFRTAPLAVREAIVPARDAYEARWTALLRDLQADGAISSVVDINVARLIMFGAMNAAIDWFDRSRGSLDGLAELITEQFWNGIGA